MLLPKANKKDLIDIPANVKRDIKFIFVDEINEVFKHAVLDQEDLGSGFRKKDTVRQ
jgi:ATP-dependent Lon protease